MTNVKERPVFVLKLRPEPQVTDPIKALRAALKQLLRRHGLKCLTVYEVELVERAKNFPIPPERGI